MKRHILRFKKSEKGAVVIEFLFSIVMLLALLFFMFDLTLVRGNIGKLDNLSYSLASLLRERTLLHSEGQGKVNNTLSENDLDEFRQLAKMMFYGDPHDTRPLDIVLDSLVFWELYETQRDKPNELHYGYSKSFRTNNKCKPTTDLKKLKDLAPRKLEDRMIKVLPMYQVTVCVPVTYGFFESFLGGSHYKDGLLRSSSVTLGR